ncbi:EF-Tu/IF-2/RF-3 family GTPase [Caldiplasma sukawensis]
MRNINAFYYGDEEWIKKIVKKHTESDITIYGKKTENINITVIRPSRFPDKISSLTDSIPPCNIFIVDFSKRDSNLGEVILACSLYNDREFVVINSSDKEKDARILKSMNINKITFFEGDHVEMEQLLESRSMDEEFSSETRILIDHFFKVKSVGTVVLGFVISGSVEKHQTLNLNNGKIKCMVRSIQMNDVDFERAGKGSRVGLALKNIEIDDLERGDILSNEPLDITNSISGKIKSSLPGKTVDDGEIFISGSMKFIRGRKNSDAIIMDRPIVKLEKYWVIKQNANPRIQGFINNDDL